MIEVLLNKPEFEYDIHSLIKAFFPEQYVGVSAEKKEYDEKIDIRMQVNYGEDTIQITWQEIVHANEDAQANEKPGQEEVKEIPGETIQVDFSDRVRTKNPGSKPVPLTDMEMKPLGIKKENIEVDFTEGDTVVVTGGVWKDTIGVIQAMNHGKQSVTINVELFGRETPVEISFADVKLNN